ncbi:MAG: hypothetical protein M3552_05930 [Planctomycetota bacterium]|nr:hypothetical protein [Planctomycetaceae bacterium]MDQ3330177.1 hypothetical protein [Planctomycetota bacterium]
MASVPVDFDQPRERPLVSGTSILIFAAFLAGAVFGQAIPRVVQFHALTAAAAGTLAYIGLWYTNLVQTQQAASKASERVSRRLERKLGKHLTTRADLMSGVNRRIDPNRGK